MEFGRIKNKIAELATTVPWFKHVVVTRGGLGSPALELSYTGLEGLQNDASHRAEIIPACHRLLDRFQEHIDSARKDLDNI